MTGLRNYGDEALNPVPTLLDPTINADEVDFLQAGTGAVTRTTQAKLREIVSVTDFGAVGDGVTDDTAAFTAALAAADTVFVPDPLTSYKLTAKIAIGGSQTLVGLNKRTTKLLHSFNGDMFDLGDGARLENLYLEGQGATFSGAGVLMTATNGGQGIHHCRIINFDSACIDFAVGAGSGFSGFDIETYRVNAGTGTGRYAITISSTQQLSAVPRKFSHIETGGQCSFDFGGCNNVYVSESFLSDLNYTVDSRAVFVIGCRIANAATLSFNGQGNVIAGGDINPVVTIAAGAQGCVVGPNAMSNPPVVDNSGFLTNQIFDYVHAQTGYLKLTTAVSKVVPGATSLSFRNNADSADNLILTDAGAASFRTSVILQNAAAYNAKDTGGTARALMVLASDNTVQIGSVGTPSSNGHLLFYVNGTERARATPSSTWTFNGGLLMNGSSGSLGYGTGAGGAVTQITSAATGVTLNKATGQITTFALTTAAGAEERFTVSNTFVAATDTISIGTTYNGAGTPAVTVLKVATNAFDIVITNLHAANALDALMVINFAIIKAVAA